MEKLRVDLSEKSYDIIFEDSFSSLGLHMKNIGAPKKLLIIADSNVYELYSEEVKAELTRAGFDVSVFKFPAGEENKNMETILTMCDACIKEQLDRKSIIVALGGGVTGDMAGFCASIFMRGIDFVQIPTTLLSQCDSSVGGKTGIDFGMAKNILGSFYQPKMVYINVSTLKTLPKREFISGMGEVIKHGVIRDKDLFEYIENNADKILQMDNKVLIEIIKSNCSVKADVVSNDEKENSLRRILNFGHTIGHAIESAMNFKLTHGECVALGMLCIFQIAKERGKITDVEVKRLENILLSYGFKTKIDIPDFDKILSLVRVDKKKQGAKVTFIMPEGIGKTSFCDDITDDEIKASLLYIKES